MEFRRITSLPPYVFTNIDSLKIEARRAGTDVIDLGFGNPDLPSPEIAVDKLTEAWGSMGLAYAMYSKSSWSSLTAALRSARKADGVRPISRRKLRLKVDSVS